MSEELKSGTDLVPAARREGTAVVASIRGDIDMHNSPELRTAMLDVLLRGDPRKLVLNLAEVHYMDSSAIAVLVEGLQKMRRAQGKVFLTNLQPRVLGLLQIARLDTIFIIAADEQEALAK